MLQETIYRLNLCFFRVLAYIVPRPKSDCFTQTKSTWNPHPQATKAEPTLTFSGVLYPALRTNLGLFNQILEHSQIPVAQ